MLYAAVGWMTVLSTTEENSTAKAIEASRITVLLMRMSNLLLEWGEGRSSQASAPRFVGRSCSRRSERIAEGFDVLHVPFVDKALQPFIVELSVVA
jgi:hypothetical protein